MDVTPQDWGKLMGDVGYIRAKIEELDDIPQRVRKLEEGRVAEKSRQDEQEDTWRRKDKVYIRLFAAIGSIGAIVSMSVLVVQVLSA